MSEFTQAMRFAGGNLGLHVKQYPSGKWGFVGSVPAVLAYIHTDGYRPTDSEFKEIQQSSNPAWTARHLGIKTRVFDTESQARFAAAREGFEVK